MITADDIVALYVQRRKDQGLVIDKMREVRDAYNGDVIVPLPELDTDEKPYVANLLASGLDQTAQRTASTLPNLIYPAMGKNETARDNAKLTRLANMGWWQENKIKRKMYRRARYYHGYGAAPVLIIPNKTKCIPEWHVRDPLTSFPAPMRDPDDLCPDDVINGVQRTVGWLRRKYPDKVAQLGFDHNTSRDTKIEVLDYVDADEIVLVATAASNSDDMDTPYTSGNGSVILERVPNLAGICTAVTPGRITLGRIAGQFDGMLGMYRMKAKLEALSVIATQRGIFPDMVMIGRPGEVPKIISNGGKWQDGRTGKINIVSGGEIDNVRTDPGYTTNPTIDRIERAERLTANIPSDFGGESNTNVRTGARGDALLDSAISFPLQEAQETFAASLEEENKRAIAVAKGYFGDKPKSIYVNMAKVKGQVEYTPNKHFTSDVNTVAYALPGSDANSLTIAVGQRIGLGIMSKRTAMSLDPLVDDPDMEAGLVISDGLEAALLSGLQQQAQSGQISPADLAAIQKMVTDQEMSLAEAVERVHKAAQERQATSGPPGAPDGPVDPASPEAQPGLAVPGVGAEAGTAPSGENLGELDTVLRRLRNTNRQSPVEQAAS